MTKVAFVGLGDMGWPMASTLVEAGFLVTGIDADHDRAHAWARVHDSPRTPTSWVPSIGQISDVVDVVVTMLPTGAEVREVLLEAAVDAKDGLVAIDMSSADPVGTRELGAELASSGVRLVDAPVSGGVQRAAGGTLTIMIGGEPDAVEAARPVLAAVGDRLFEVGGLGDGHAIDCLVEFVAGAAFLACSEALAVGERFGLDPATMFDVMNASPARCFSTEMVMKQQVVSGEFASGCALGRLADAVGIADALATAVDADTPLADLVAARFAEARDALGVGADHTSAHRHWTR